MQSLPLGVAVEDPDLSLPREGDACIGLLVGPLGLCGGRQAIPEAAQWNGDLAEAQRFLGAALGHQGKQLQALAAYRRATECAPDDAMSLRSYGGTLAECGQLHAALRVLARAEALEPDALAMQQLRGMFDLVHGLFSDGWSAYRSRPAYQVLSKKWANATLTQTLPDDLAGGLAIVADNEMHEPVFRLGLNSQ